MFKSLRGGLTALILTFFVISGCGYKIAGLEERANYTLSINSVYNMSSEPDLEREIEDVAVNFFSGRSALGDNGKSRYIADLRLRKLNFESRIVTKTGQTGTSSVTCELEIIIHDRTGKEVFTGNFSGRTVYDLTSDIGTNKRNRTDAINYVIKQSLTDFYHAFRP
ncbi:hypothetical protein EP073_06865 [Geovibrio thiophilus]|uniref:DUF4410 domain-containing protein n=1 Tax=Geovibrio thiophilus TaxID=139438 RepID=A0A410JYD6_9BACT|nr:hypothetical protein [Geovibrio thiophilus]QAR33129.1 hypothetical protein EP073_06865 [Geovibrio thiophilus]